VEENCRLLPRERRGTQGRPRPREQRADADNWVDRGRILWAADEITWGIWGVPESKLRFALIHGDAERAPLRDATFDLAISEYGVAIWCDPDQWIPRRRGSSVPAESWCSSATPSSRW
jgi:hypothetical protein